tara:strand:- start:148 stop:333 length:186 start_codon:yes stop_codon:yes gene_type:complete
MKKNTIKGLPNSFDLSCKMLAVGMTIKVPKTSNFIEIKTYIESTYGYKLEEVNPSRALRVL